jgi:hypothetical protein
VWLDQAYWQRAIASRPETSVKAYLAGGMAWYGIPFSFATIMGLACAALTADPRFPTFPNPLSAAQNGEGLSAPAAAIALLGKGGAGLMLLLLFMAVTSSTSAELIAVSSLLTFDVYKTYIRRDASSSELVRISHYGILIYGAALATFCCILNAVNVNLTWILTVLGVIVGGGAIPVGLILMWDKMSWIAVIVAPWISLAVGLITWFVTTSRRSGAISVATTGDPLNALAGNIASTVMGLLSSIVLSYLFPKKYVSDDPRAIARAEKVLGTARSQTEDTSDPEASMGEKLDNSQTGGETKSAPQDKPVPVNGLVEFLETSHTKPMDPEAMRASTRLAVGFNLAYFLIVVVLVPFSLYGSEWIFSRAGFKGWCVVSFIWVWCSMIICVVWPLVESRKNIAEIVKRMVADLGGGGNRQASQPSV